MKKGSSRDGKTKASRKRNGDFHFDARALVRAAQLAVREALRQHKRAGNPVAGVIKGKVVLVPPSRIKIWFPFPQTHERPHDEYRYSSARSALRP